MPGFDFDAFPYADDSHGISTIISTIAQQVAAWPPGMPALPPFDFYTALAALGPAVADHDDDVYVPSLPSMIMMMTVFHLSSLPSTRRLTAPPSLPSTRRLTATPGHILTMSMSPRSSLTKMMTTSHLS